MDVDQVLHRITEREHRIAETIIVDRNLQFDVGNLTAWDPNPVTLPNQGPEREDYFRQLARDNVQSMLNNLYSIKDTEIKEGERYLKLPDAVTVFPRAKPIPMPHIPTKWERFAESKGIKSKSSQRKDKLVWDETADKFVPRYGYKKAKLEEQKDWLIEIPDNADPNVDYFAKKKEEKKERVAKNKFQQLRNKLN